MAMAAVANTLATRGLSVLAVDFDLEAPGLERYFFDAEGSRFQRKQPGLIDLIRAYRRALSNEAEFAKADFKRWDLYKLTAIHTASSLGGSVDLMTAGAREPEERMHEYALAVRSFDWQDFFYNWKGDQFFGWLRRQWTSLDSGYDVVLIDSRTGVTEMGGVCAYQLADVAVLLCAPNYQNLDGTRAVVRDFRSNAVTGLRHGRELQILVVPARVEQDHPHKNEFLDTLERQIPRSEGLPKALADVGLDYRALAIPYLPEYAVGDRLVGGEAAPTPPNEALTTQFERLADALTLLEDPASPMGQQRADALARLGGSNATQPVKLVADTTQSSAGYDVFLDYSREDSEEALRLRASIEESGRRVFVDTKIGMGDNWTDEIRVALEYTDTLFFCLGRRPPSEWRVSLLSTARRLGRIRIIPVLLEGVDRTSLRSLALDDLVAINLTTWPDPERLQSLIRQSLQATHQECRVQSNDTMMRPYPGAAPYGEDDSRFFAGREQESQALMDALLTHEIVFLQGAAKVGKTSLIRAGLIPLFRSNIGIADGLNSNSVVLLEADKPNGLRLDAMTAGLYEVSRKAPLSTAYPNLLLIDDIDSFPNGAKPEAYAHRISAVIQLLDYAAPGCHILLTWRDTFPSEERTKLLQSVAQHQHAHVQLKPLSGEALRAAIEEPAKRAGHLLEPGLTERLLESAAKSHNAIFQIQLALAALWQDRRRGWLTNKSLDSLGHLGGIFIRHLDSKLALLTQNDRSAAVVLFKTLSRLSPSLRLMPEPQAWAAVATIPKLNHVGAARLRDWLAQHGLIDLWTGDSTGQTPGDKTSPHVALVRPNPMHYLGGDENIPDAAFFMWRGQFASYVLHWNSTMRSNDALLSGNALSEAEAWLSSKEKELTEPERSFIHTSLAERERRLLEEEARQAAEREKDRLARQTAEELLRVEQEKAESLNREFLVTQTLASRMRTGLVAIAMLFMLVVIFAYLYITVATQQRDVAENKERLAKSKHKEVNSLRLTAESLAMLKGTNVGEDSRALLQLLAAHRTAAGNVVNSGILEAQVLLTDTVKIILAESAVTAIAFSPDGTRLVSGSRDTTLRLWDVKSGQPLGAPLTGHKGVVYSVAFSPDGTRLVSGSGDMTLRLWDAKSGQPLGAPLTGHKGVVGGVAFSPDGTRLVSGSWDTTLRLWDAKSGQPLGAPLTGHKGVVGSVAFSPDGTRLVSGSWDTTLRLWDAKSGQPLGVPLTGHKGVVYSVAFSPDGTRLVSGSDDTTLRLWDAKTGQLTGHKGVVGSVAFSPDGTRLVSGSGDTTLRLWDAKSGQPLGAPLTGHKGVVYSVAFSPDGTRLVSGSRDTTLRLWDVKSGQPLGVPLTGHKGVVYSVAFSPDGTRLVSGSGDTTLRLWDAKSGQPLGAPLTGHEGVVYSVAFSPDGTRLVSGSRDTTLRLWDAKSGQPLGAPLTGHEGVVYSVAFSPDGTRLVSGGWDTTLRLWDVKSGQPLGAPLTGHKGVVYSVAFRPDGTRLVSGSRDTTLRLWDVKSGQPLGVPLIGTKGIVYSVAFSPDGTRLVSGSGDTTLRLWPIPKVWPAELCAKLTRNMSYKEWNEWVSREIPYTCQCSGLPIPLDVPNSTDKPEVCPG